MNNDLKWLAENVHEWKQGTHYLVKTLDGGCNWIVGEMEIRDNAANYFTRAQWQAARDELSGKPSWDDVPEWAEWIAQSPQGHWECYADQPDFNEGRWVHSGRGECVGFAKYRGEVLGDWRNTVERRPEMKQKLCKTTTMQGVPETMNNEIDYSVRKGIRPTPKCEDFELCAYDADGASHTLKVSFNESDQIVDAVIERVNNNVQLEWRGPEDGLPPVNSIVEYTSAPGEWIRVRILGHHPTGNDVIWHESIDTKYSDGTSNSVDSLILFRPILSE